MLERKENMIIRDFTLEMTEEAQKLVWLNYEEAQKNHPALPEDCEIPKLDVLFQNGLGAAELLDYMMKTLKAEGVLRIGVDCESFNPTAIRFWTKHFAPYTQSLVRRIDENAVG